MQPTVSDRIGHIANAIGNIQEIVAGQTRDSFTNDLVMRMAVERLLEIISEASRYAGLLWVMIEDDLEPLRAFVERIARETKR